MVAGVLIMFLTAGFAFAADKTMKANMPAQATTYKGDSRIDLPAARYPRFEITSDVSGGECKGYLEAEAPAGLSLAPIHTPSKITGTAAGSEAVFTDINGFTDVKVSVPDEYQTSAKIVVSWTMQVLGDKSQVIEINPMLCGEWYGEANEIFPQGYQVLTQLYADNKVRGEEFRISIPEGELRQVRYDPPPPPPQRASCEPTLTGTVILQPSDFGGKFPKEISLTVKWKNDCPLPVYSPADSRQMTVTIIPLNVEN
jgi:hypothetical protein